LYQKYNTMVFSDLFKQVDLDTWNDQVPTYPGLSLLTHVSARTLQVGSVLGIVTGIVTTRFVKAPFSSHLIKCSGGGAFLGAVAGGVAVAAMAANGRLDADGLADRAYRLKHNEKQNSLSQQQIAASLVGIAAISFLFPKSGPLGVLAGVGLGSAAVFVPFFVGTAMQKYAEKEKEKENL